MKTVQQIQTEIADVEHRLAALAAIRIPSDDDRREGKRLSKRLQALRHFKMYLETGPTEAVLIEQRNKLVNTIEKITATAEETYKSTSGKDYNLAKQLKKGYCTERGVPVLEAQLETLNYLLSA